ncbi:MAG: beta-ketoacyl-[acyl-carrier-protein] synthase family protein [Bacteroidales bacterium]|jgi:3-oxoacyl-[acyl-carrier-protein] synthase-1|nr:beta-ketoacyl-[acyl-carrier-protein] synthase family protein [Bacteroidales bacterium]
MCGRIAITGAGIVSALGTGVDETLRSLMDGICPISFPKHLKTIHSNLPCGEVDLSDAQLYDLCHEDRGRVLSRSSLLGIVAARQAEEDARLGSSDRVAFINGTTVGGMDITERYYRKYFQGSDYDALIPLHLDGVATDAIADSLECDVVFTDVISTACSAAANAIALGAELIESGRFDIVIAGGMECLTKFHLNGFNSLMILDQEPCRPFDASRKGLNLGEGAAYIVLENKAHALERGARIRAFLSGWGNTCDAYHQTASSPDGAGALEAMRKALEVARLNPSDIDYVNAHGTGTENNDLSEGKALMTLFGDRMPYVGSTKCFTGHATSAAAGLEAVISILCIESGLIPANLRFRTKDPGLDFSPVAEKIENIKLNHVLSNSFGFGGNDSSLIFSRAEL